MEIELFLNEFATKEIDDAFLLEKNKIEDYLTYYKLLLNYVVALKRVLIDKL